jgi:hypothetical protein
MILNQEKLNTILGDYKKGDRSALPGDIIFKVSDYKRNVASRYIALSREDTGSRLTGESFHLSRKIDGEFCCLFSLGDEVFLCTPSGTVFSGVPCLQQVPELLKKENITSAVFAGEFYYRRPDGKRSRIYDLISASSNPKDEEEVKGLSFAPFDIIEINNEEYKPSDYAETSKMLKSLFSNSGGIEPPDSQVVKNKDEVLDCYTEWVEEEESEGLVIRSSSNFIYKLKPKHSLDAVILGYVEGVRETKGMVRSLLTGLLREDGKIQVAGTVGGGLSDSERSELCARLKKIEGESEFIEVHSKYGPYKMVKPEIVIEIDYLDLMTTNRFDRPYKMMVLDMDESVYRIVRKMPFPVLISPRFSRFREDKNFNKEDLRLTQITDRVPIDEAGTSVEKIEYPEPDILLREVYTKQLKGKTGVRKLLLWKTNREELDENYAAYNFCYTDFSPGRSDPLKKDVRISNSKDQIFALADEFREKNIKKGWEPA